MRRLPLLLLALPALAACRVEGPAAEAAPPPPPRPVQVAEVRLAPAAAAASAFTGSVRARREVEVGFRASGRVAERLVEVGQRVAAGQVLARLDPADLALALRAAEADLAAAEAQARQAANDAARSRALLAAGHVAAAFDDQRQASARAAAERAASARAGLDLARNRLAFATLRAPSAGVVTALLAEAGQVLPEGQPLLRLADPAERELLVRVPESALATLPEAAAEAGFWARPGVAVPAALREVAPQADATLRTYAARFALPEAPDWVALGMTGTVRLARAAAEPVATLPRAALHDRGAGPMVWRVTATGRLEPVTVQVRALADQTVQVAGALREGERVVALGAQLLDPAQTVRVVETRLAATLR
jgi:multidrug efflux system membrane fusion protein